MDRRREELRCKYLKLGTGELAAAAVFALVASTLVLPSLSHARDQAALCSALAPLLIVLLQARRLLAFGERLGRTATYARQPGAHLPRVPDN